MGEALLVLGVIFIIYHAINGLDNGVKKVLASIISPAVGPALGCAAILAQFAYGVVIIVILIWIVGLFS